MCKTARIFSVKPQQAAVETRRELQDEKITFGLF